MIELIGVVLYSLMFFILAMIFLAILVIPIIEVLRDKFFPPRIDTSINEREDFMENVWLSCKTEDQRYHALKWIHKVAKPWPSKELKNVLEYITIMEDIRNDTNWFGTMEAARMRQAQVMAGYCPQSCYKIIVLCGVLDMKGEYIYG